VRLEYFIRHLIFILPYAFNPKRSWCYIDIQLRRINMLVGINRFSTRTTPGLSPWLPPLLYIWRKKNQLLPGHGKASWHEDSIWELGLHTFIGYSFLLRPGYIIEPQSSLTCAFGQQLNNPFHRIGRSRRLHPAPQPRMGGQ